MVTISIFSPQFDAMIMQRRVALYGQPISWLIAAARVAYPPACPSARNVSNVEITKDTTSTCSEVKPVVLVIVVTLM